MTEDKKEVFSAEDACLYYDKDFVIVYKCPRQIGKTTWAVKFINEHENSFLIVDSYDMKNSIIDKVNNVNQLKTMYDQYVSKQNDDIEYVILDDIHNLTADCVAGLRRYLKLFVNLKKIIIIITEDDSWLYDANKKKEAPEEENKCKRCGVTDTQILSNGLCHRCDNVLYNKDDDDGQRVVNMSVKGDMERKRTDREREIIDSLKKIQNSYELDLKEKIVLSDLIELIKSIDNEGPKTVIISDYMLAKLYCYSLFVSTLKGLKYNDFYDNKALMFSISIPEDYVVLHDSEKDKLKIYYFDDKNKGKYQDNKMFFKGDNDEWACQCRS